jgi:hypothetical protein
MEYNEILDKAGVEPDSAKRMAYVGIYMISQITICERTASKPFNPLLSETYEYVCKDFSFLSEQVSHHPPVTANYCRSNKGLYSIHNNQKTNTKFNGKYLALHQQYRSYIDLDRFDERYECEMPVMSAHNLVIGRMYVDVGDAMVIRKVAKPDGTKVVDKDELCELNFTRSGLFTKQEFKVEGEVTLYDEETFSRKSVIKIHGNWNNTVYMRKMVDGKPVGEPETVFKKNPYPENWESMYGMSHFSLQMNYFPRRLHNLVAPTDTRRRSDQRALENGDLKLAAQEKDRLETKQRAVRKMREDMHLEHRPAFFKEWENPYDNQVYFVYNGKYFEHCRPKQDWKMCPDIFSETLPTEEQLKEL